MLCGTVSAYVDNPVFTLEYLDFSGLSAILATCTREEVMYRCTHVIKLHFFLPRGLNQSMGTLHRERVSPIIVIKFDPEASSLLFGAGTLLGFSNSIFVKNFSYFVVLQVVKFIPTTLVLQL